MFEKIRSDSGVSMMEMMIAVVIVGIMAAMAVPSFDVAIEDMKFENFGREIVSHMRLARSSAVALQQPHGVYIDESRKRVLTFIDIVNPSAGEYEVGDSVIMEDSCTIQIDGFTATFPNSAIIFYPDGSASASGDVSCSDYPDGGESRYLSIYITAATGRANMDVY